MAGRTVPAEIWSLIFEHANKQDLCDLSLVSKAFKRLVAPILYQSISLIAPGRKHGRQFMRQIANGENKEEKVEPKDKRAGGHWYLLARLEDDANSTLRNYVREVSLSTEMYRSQLDDKFICHLLEDDRLCKLIARLPNLRRVTSDVEDLQTENIIRAITNHHRAPDLSLSIRSTQGEIKSICGDDPQPCLTELKAHVSLMDERDGQNCHLLTVQKLLFNSPNLRFLNLIIHWDYGGCMPRVPSFSTITSFQFTGKEKFPPIENLSLDGYKIGEGEWVHWRDRLDWSRLTCLKLGPQDSSGILGRLARYATSLRTLKVSCFTGERSQDYAGLEALMSSFDTLTTLELNGFICSAEAVARHKGMTTLLLHEDEPDPGEGQKRRVFTAEELAQLDRKCPGLRSLSVDIKRGDNQWPTDVFSTLATGFKNLQSLSLHFELGLEDLDHPITPILKYDSAHSISQSFFSQRIGSGIHINKSFTLTLWTGRCYRRWPQWEPLYIEFETMYTATYEFRRGEGEEIEFRHLQKEDLEDLESQPGGDDDFLFNFEKHQLVCQVNGAVEGATKDWRHKQNSH